jgi:uncharacterized sulfatase
MLTGLYPHQHKVCWNDPPAGVDRNSVLHLMKNTPTVPRLLGEAGYVSLQTGKFWEGHYSNAGFTHGMSLNEVHGRHGDEGLKIGRNTMQPIYDFIERAEGRPFFVWYAPMMPHEPHNPPNGFWTSTSPKIARCNYPNTGRCASGSTRPAANCSSSSTADGWRTRPSCCSW